MKMVNCVIFRVEVTVQILTALRRHAEIAKINLANLAMTE